MKDTEYLAHVATLSGLRFYEKQGPWGRNPGTAMGVRDGRLVCVGLTQINKASNVVIIVRFKKFDQAEMVKTTLAQNAALTEMKHGKLAAVGQDFLRWEWIYRFSKPKPEEVAKLVNQLLEAIQPIVAGFDSKCEDCQSTTETSLQNGLPVYRCAGCQEKVRLALGKAGMDYDAIVPNHVNGLALGFGAAILGALAWGLIAYAINYIFLIGAIGIGYFVAWAMIKGSGKVTRLGQILVPILTVASVLFGDVIFYTLHVMRAEGYPFSTHLVGVIVTHLWGIEKAGGPISIFFGLVGAGYALYASRRPKFQVTFEPLGAPAA